MIKKVLSKMLLSIMLFVFLFTNTSIAAVIITSEKSTDNDEADQQIEIDATTDAVSDLEGEEVATIKQKIEKELETQMKEGIAENAKSKINTQIYINESTILGDIGRAWKEVVKTEITDERAERIYTVYVENLEEYAGKKIEAWINEYYTNNKDRIVTKVNKYIDGDESMISMAVSTVVYTALDDLEDEMEKLVTETNGKIGSIVKDVLSQYEKISTWEEKAVEAICLEIPIQIGESLNNIFSQKFSWETEKLTEGLSLLETTESVITKEFNNQTAEYIKNKFGYDSTSSITDILLDYGMSLLTENLDSNNKKILSIVRGVIFSEEDVNKWNSIWDSVYSQAETLAKKTYNETVDNINKSGKSELEKRKNLKKAEDKLKDDLVIADSQATEAARNAMTKEALDNFDKTVDELGRNKRKNA